MPDTHTTSVDQQRLEKERIEDDGTVTLTRGGHAIHCLTVIGQVDGSPAEKSPCTSSAPAASSEARPPRIAWPAPASTTIVPRGSAAKPIHRRREEPRALTGANTVPTGSPIIAGPAFEAQVSTVGMPETAATRAASSLVTMPPVPTFEPVPPT